MKRPFPWAIAILLAAVVAVLVGFQGVSTVLTITEFGAAAKLDDAERRAHTRVAAIAPSLPATSSEPTKAEPQAPTPSSATEPADTNDSRNDPADASPPSTGVAAAARAKALAEIEAMERSGAMEQGEEQRARRTYRAPRVDKHRVY